MMLGRQEEDNLTNRELRSIDLGEHFNEADGTRWLGMPGVSGCESCQGCQAVKGPLEDLD